MFIARINKFFFSTLTRRSTFSLVQKRLFAMDKLTRIGTHDGTFHCDEVLGCYMLKLLSPNASIVRSRNEEILKTCDIVIDVGGNYDPERKLFDHHQNGFELTATPFLPDKVWDIKLSSAGLIYCHYGKEIISKILGNIDESALNFLFYRVYEDFIREIDAIDNGIPICDGQMRYYISTNLSARVKHLNPQWNDENSDVETRFKSAMDLVGLEFRSKVERMYNHLWPARKIVMDAIMKRNDLHSSGEIIELETFCPWQTHLFEIEEELKILPGIKYVIFPASQSRTVWRVQAVPKEAGSFLLRCPLHQDWRGFRDDELSKVSGIKGCIFVHATGFIGGNSSREGALEMAEKSLKQV